MPAHILRTAKAYAAFVGAIVAGLLGVFGPDTPVGQALTVIAAIATAIVVFQVPNLDDQGAGKSGLHRRG